MQRVHTIIEGMALGRGFMHKPVQVVFRSLDPFGSESSATINAVTTAMREHGLVQVAVEGEDGQPASAIDRLLVERFYKQWHAIVELANHNPELRKEWARPETGNQRGLTGPGVENNDASCKGASGRADDKWFWYANHQQRDGYRPDPFFPCLTAQNFFPPLRLRFHVYYLEVGRAMHQVAMKILAVLAEGMGVPDETLLNVVEGGMHGTRAIYYPPLTAREVKAGALWAANHTDCNLLTVLLGARFVTSDGNIECHAPEGLAGLWQRTRIGERLYGASSDVWSSVQVGQQLEMVTDGAFQATEHEVIPPLEGGIARMQMAHFCHAHPRIMLEPLPSFCGEEQVFQERSRLAGQFMQASLVHFGLMSDDLLATRIREQFSTRDPLFQDHRLAWIPRLLEEEGVVALRKALIYQGHSNLHATTSVKTST